MRKIKFTSLALMLFVFLNSCQDDGHNGILVHLDSFPLTIGNSWKYHTVVEVDTIGGHYIDKTYNSYLFVDSDTIINTILSSKIVHIDSNSSGTVLISSQYYANQINGFYGTAADFISSQILLKNTNSKYLFQDALLCAFGDFEKDIDSVFISQSPLYLMKFPVVIGESWN